MEEIHIQCPYCLQAISIPLDTGIYEPATIAYIGELGHLNRKHLDSLCKNIF